MTATGKGRRRWHQREPATGREREATEAGTTVPEARARRPWPCVGDRRGFSLAELAVTVMIVGIVAGVALPNLRHALMKAEAAAMMADANTVSLAAYEHLSDTGTFPASGAYGTPPADLLPYLPDGFSFTKENGVTYAWFAFNLPSYNSYWQTRTLGLFVVNYSARQDLATAMQAHAGPDRYWSPSIFYVIYRG